MNRSAFVGSVFAVSVLACGLVFADDYEPNNSTLNAKLAPTQGIVRGATLTAGDNDLYRLIPNRTGVLDVRLIAVYGPGNADLYVYDNDLNTIASASSTTDNETIVIPVVEGETYYLNVIEVSIAATGDYELYLDTDAVPAPRKPIKETKVTREVNCTGVGSILIQADLKHAADAGIQILTPAQAFAGNPGYSVWVEILSATEAVITKVAAEPVASTDNQLYRIDMVDVGNVFYTPEGKVFVKSYIRVIDGATFTNYGEGRRSGALVLNCKHVAPL